jgi:hypothetical protein
MQAAMQPVFLLEDWKQFAEVSCHGDERGRRGAKRGRREGESATIQ